MFHEFFFYFKLFKPFNFFASSPSIDRFRSTQRRRAVPRECSNIRRSDRSHNSERARSLSGPELPPLLSYDVHKRDLRYRKISSSRFRFETHLWNQLSWRARYLLITPEIRRVDKEFEWMARIKSFFFSILLANILVRRIIILPIHAGARGWWLRKHRAWNCFLFFLSFFFPFFFTRQPIIIIITGRSNSLNTMAGRKWVESVGQCVITI